jgi:hypothetical protein
MRYLAKVKTNRNGARLILYVIFRFINIPIEIESHLHKGLWFLIDRKLKQWKDYYGDKLTVIDNRKI